MQIDEGAIRAALEKRSDEELSAIVLGDAEGYRPVAIAIAAQILTERGTVPETHRHTNAREISPEESPRDRHSPSPIAGNADQRGGPTGVGGWLGILAALMVVNGLISGLILVAYIFALGLDIVAWWKLGPWLVVSAAVVIYWWAATIALWTERPGGARMAGWALLLAAVINFIATLPSIGTLRWFLGMGVPLVWYVYLKTSERVARTFPES